MQQTVDAVADNDPSFLGSDFERLLEYCESKNYNEEGIPMYLVLEDVSGQALGTGAPPVVPRSGDSFFNLMLVTALEIFRQHKQGSTVELQPQDIGRMLEVLAEHYSGIVSFRSKEKTNV
jgi:hypothetical protein